MANASRVFVIDACGLGWGYAAETIVNDPLLSLALLDFFRLASYGLFSFGRPL